jgi:hypothetical protein
VQFPGVNGDLHCWLILTGSACRAGLGIWDLGFGIFLTIPA